MNLITARYSYMHAVTIVEIAVIFQPFEAEDRALFELAF